MPKLTITVGVSASGKTTWVESLTDEELYNTVNLNRDDIRFNMIRPGGTWKTYNPNGNEAVAKRFQLRLAQLAVSFSARIIVSDTNLKSIDREFWRQFAKNNGYDFEIKEFPISLEEAIERDSKRKNSVEEEVIRNQYKLWLEYLESKETKGS
jgi:predicted kinase